MTLAEFHVNTRALLFMFRIQSQGYGSRTGKALRAILATVRAFPNARPSALLILILVVAGMKKRNLNVIIFLARV